MRRKNEPPKTAQLVWKETQKTMTLTGETVLEISLSWPELADKRLRSVNRYYQRLREAWEKQWSRDIYWCACVDLARKREQSRPFSPWTARLTGRVTQNDGQFLSIALCAQEVHGDGLLLEYRWGDTWRQEDGAPVRLKELFPEKRRWRRPFLWQTEEAAQRARGQGVYLDADLKGSLRKWLSTGRFALEGEELLLFYPQCTIAPAVEGAVELRLPLSLV
ncbi:MAG: DUF3298 domain-containing protein [Oscillibacter sp.]|nr:DUF3298 domain-containing protein [Oscillibacter sp.]